MKNMRKLSALLALLLALCLCFSGCDDILSGLGIDLGDLGGGTENGGSEHVSLSDIPAYSGKAYVAVNGNVPFFTEEEIKTQCTNITVSSIRLGAAVWYTLAWV